LNGQYENGGAGTYTRPNGSGIWVKQS
jgi:hypothetical protein